MTSAWARAPACCGVISCSCAEALGASRQVRLIVRAASLASAPAWLVFPDASVLSREMSLAAAAIWVT